MAKKIKRKDITLGLLGEICAEFVDCNGCPFDCRGCCYILHYAPELYRYDYMDEEVSIPEEALIYGQN